jgi:hypothetical protein
MNSPHRNTDGSLRGWLFSGVAAIFLANAAPAAPPQEACLLSSAEISAAVATPVADGTYMGSFRRTCTWKAAGPAKKSVKYVTLMLQDGEAFDGGKRLASSALVVTPVSGVGDDAYFLRAGEQVGLVVRQGAGAFKVTVYADMPLQSKQAMEKALAANVVTKF